ncbi:hypothetical protein HJD18_12785 [Thermoleophilia bacterium SCSIO 60948]|nr:hypothetical protein HJD18_12785 [Thermoleophilia bacterium SCSIO 60948]
MTPPEPAQDGRSAGRDVLVVVDAGSASVADVLLSVDSALGARPGHLRVEVGLDERSPQRDALRELLDPDPHVSLVGRVRSEPRDQELLIDLPAGVELGRETLDAIERELGDGGRLVVAVPRHPSRLSGVDPVAARTARRRIVAAKAGGGPARTVGVHKLTRAGGGLAETAGTLGLGSLADERGEHLRNRARSATYRSRFDAVSQVLARDRLRTRHERARVVLFERRLAELSPRAWAAMRSRQARDAASVVPSAARSGTRTVKQQGRRARRFAIDRARSRKLSG